MTRHMSSLRRVVATLLVGSTIVMVAGAASAHLDPQQRAQVLDITWEAQDIVFEAGHIWAGTQDPGVAAKAKDIQVRARKIFDRCEDLIQ